MPVGVDACGKEGLMMVWQQQRFRHVSSLSLSLAADATACRLHIGMENGQWCG
jgi:hypothetical protein